MLKERHDNLTPNTFPVIQYIVAAKYRSELPLRAELAFNRIRIMEQHCIPGPSSVPTIQLGNAAVLSTGSR